MSFFVLFIHKTLQNVHKKYPFGILSPAETAMLQISTKKQPHYCDCYYVPEGIRTPDPRLRRPLLYPAELLAHPLTQAFAFCQSGRQDSNLRPPGP